MFFFKKKKHLIFFSPAARLPLFYSCNKKCFLLQEKKYCAKKNVVARENLFSHLIIKAFSGHQKTFLWVQIFFFLLSDPGMSFFRHGKNRFLCSRGPLLQGGNEKTALFHPQRSLKHHVQLIEVVAVAWHGWSVTRHMTGDWDKGPSPPQVARPGAAVLRGRPATTMSSI